jgi:predicted acyl esterase
VHVTSSNFPRWDRNLNTGEDLSTATTLRVAHQAIHHAVDRPSSVVLPIIPAE